MYCTFMHTVGATYVLNNTIRLFIGRRIEKFRYLEQCYKTYRKLKFKNAFFIKEKRSKMFGTTMEKFQGKLKKTASKSHKTF